jgi:diacylglycerol kinase family enzyme
VGEVNGKPFFNVASMGLSTRMMRELTQDLKQRWGRLGYAVATLWALSRVRAFTAEIRSGGEVHTVRTLQISVGNGRHYGGGMTVQEDAEIDDGCLNLHSLEFDRLRKLALVYPAFRRVGRVSGRKCATETPGQFRILRRAVAVIAPAP